MSDIDLVSAALVAAQGEMPAAGFDSQNPFLRNRYASLGAIIECSRPVLAKHGLAILQIPCATDSVVTVDTHIIHKSGQRLTAGSLCLSIGEEKGKSRAQVAGSIITYLRRYAWATCLGIYAEEDTDGEPERPTTHQRVSTPPTTHQNAPESQPAAPAGIPEATPAYRMKALNKLEAAPGQPRRQLFQHYLEVHKWLMPRENPQPEDWDLAYVPRNPLEMQALVEDVQKFEREMRSQPETTE